MYRVVLFGGTTEGRVIARVLAETGVPSAVFVATEYGEQALEFDALGNASETAMDVFARRIDEAEMKRLFAEHRPEMVIDATHPYAAIVSGNISRAAKAVGVRYVRVLRPSTLDRESSGGENLFFFQTIEQMVAWLNTSDERIFSTLGAKDLPWLAKIRDFESRVLVRILPTVEGISVCNELGFPMKHILGLHGPFSEEYNMVQYRENRAQIVITKDTGKAGGFDQKVTAALKSGLKVAVLERPIDETDFVSLEEMVRMLREADISGL
ncbi:MAG: precorrin-6A reductase [Bacillota bacterium]|nr:precorrin-6A reductase [Bacillota bacterium]